jgi:small subunit ribosomal protein S16
MPTKIRLQRKGKKGMPFYHVVIADGRAPRDGKFIERIGIYNPVSRPAEIDINFDRAVYWLQSGAQPTDTVRALLSTKGILYKHHLLKGVRKGALTEELAEAKFQAWIQEKQEKLLSKIKEEDLAKKDARKKRHEAELKANEAKAKELAAKRAKEMAAARKEEAAEEEVAVEEAVAETPVAEAPVMEEPVVEEPVAEAVAEVIEETPVVEAPVAEAVAEVIEETPAVEEAIAEEAAAELTEEPAAELAAAEETPEAEAEPGAETEEEPKA